MERVVKRLTDRDKSIATMESCTGGGVCNQITNIEGASQVLKFSAVTYSNEFKIKMGVDRDIIDKFSVYSEEVANEMSKNISIFANSNYGIGITGKLNRIDKDNLFGSDDLVFISIYDKDLDKFYNYNLKVFKSSREDNKSLIIDFIRDKLLEIL